MFRFDRPVLFFKAKVHKTITVPGYYRGGTYVAPHQKSVLIETDHAPKFEEHHLADSNVNAPSHNKKVLLIQKMHEAGDVAGLHGLKTGTNTYGKKQAKLKDAAIQHLTTPVEPDPEPAAQEPEVKPAPAAPEIDWDKYKIPDTNTNATSHNKKVEAIKALHEAGDLAGLEAMKFGTNTYGKKQAKLAEVAAAHLKEFGGAAPAPQSAPDAKLADDVAAAQEKAATDVGAPSVAEAPPEPQPEPEKPADAALEVKTFKHSMKGHAVYSVQLPSKLGDAEYKAVAALAKKSGGFWSSFKKGGAIPGFHFKDEAKAQAFAKEATPIAGGKLPEPITAPAPEPSAPTNPKAEWDFEQSSKVFGGNPAYVLADHENDTAWYVAYSPDDKKYEVGNALDDEDFEQFDAPSAAFNALKAKGVTPPSVARLAGMPAAANENKGPKEGDSKTDANGDKHVFLNGDWQKVQTISKDDGPKEGDTKAGADGTLVFHNGRWHKQGSEEQSVEAALDAVPLPDLSSLGIGAQNTVMSGIVKLKQKVAQEGAAGFKMFKKVASKKATYPKMNLTFASDHSAGFYGFKVSGYAAIGPDGVAEGFSSNGKAVSAIFNYVEALKAAHTKAVGKPKKGKKAAPKIAIPATAADAAKVAAVAASKKVDGLPVANADNWKQVGQKQGSNPGGTFKDASGQDWYVKFPASLDHVKNELLASKLYGAAGVHVPKLRIVERDGKIGIASKIVPGVSNVGAGIKSAEGALEGFAVDAWLGNYDAVGTGYDNLLKTSDGKAIRIDVGGSLIYRAQGAPKTDFGNEVNEIEGMRNKAKNSYAASVFGGMSARQLDKSVALVLDVPDDVISQVVEKYGPGSAADKAALAAKLIARKNDLAKKFPGADAIANPPKPDPRHLPVDASKLPPKLNFMNWKGAGKGLSSVAAVNASNQQAADAIYASAMAGNFSALKKLKFDKVNKQTGEVEAKVSFGDHPSQHIKDFYSTILDYMEVIANPAAKKMKSWDIGDYSDIEELSDSFKAHYYGVTVGDVPANQRLGFWISLGQADAAQDFMPPKVDYISDANREAGKQSNVGIPSYLATWMKSVKVSGSANQPYRDGKEVDNQGNKTRDVLAAAYEHAVEFEEGTRLTKGISLPDAMMKQMLALEPGHVFQNPGSMCTSMKEDWSWSGSAVLHIVCSKGAKGLYNVGVGKYDGEDEVTTIPGQRFMLMQANGDKNPKEFTLLMLPPDETYVANIHPKG